MGVAADVLAVSPSGEMALSLDRRTKVSLLSTGRLARAPLGGGAPREILDGVVDADWSPDGSELAVTREAGAEAVLEYPIGHALYRGAGYLSAPRVSPDGKAVAFIRHQVKGDDRGERGSRRHGRERPDPQSRSPERHRRRLITERP